jgi:glycosyltransferase involved in cell wall biosynthesis
MNVIHLSFSDIIGGAARSSYRIHQSLLKAEVNSRMWVNKARTEDQTVEKPVGRIERIIAELRSPLINNSLVKTLKTKNKIIHSPSVLSSRWVELINESDADIVHLHWIQNEMLSISDISKIKKPIVWTLHDMWAFCGAEHYTEDHRWRDGYLDNNRPAYESGFDLNLWTWKRKEKHWKTPIQIITPSKWLAECVSKSMLMRNWPLNVISYPIDTDFWKPISKKIMREQLDLPKDVTLLLFGAFDSEKDQRKGYDLLLSTLEQLRAHSKFHDVELVVFGQNKPKLPTKHAIPIHYMGKIHDDESLRAIYNASDVILIPSRQDNLPNIAVEAHACGIPVISFNVGGLPDIIEHRKTGYIAKAFEIEDLANGILWFLSHPDKEHLNKDVREQAVLKFSQKKIAEEYLNIYKNLLQQI